jgi:hypothetical protein
MRIHELLYEHLAIAVNWHFPHFYHNKPHKNPVLTGGIGLTH